MSTTTAPKPPTKRLFAAMWATGGTSLGMLGLMSVGHFVYGNIPPGRLLAYSLIVLAVAIVAVSLAGRYLLQRYRRNAWWDGHTACKDPDADSLPLRRIQAELQELAEAVYDLADAAGRPRTPSHSTGNTYTSRAVQGDTVLITRNAQPSTPGAQTQVAEREPADPVAEARAQGFAEGYVAGIERRMEHDEGN